MRFDKVIYDIKLQLVNYSPVSSRKNSSSIRKQRGPFSRNESFAKSRKINSDTSSTFDITSDLNKTLEVRKVSVIVLN